MVVVVILPVNTVEVDIFEIFVISRMNSPGPVLDHSEEKHIPRAALTLTTYGDGVVVPGLGPFKGILVDDVEEKMVEKPDVSIRVTV